MFSFNVGPSQISDEVYNDLTDLTKNGILSISHRSKKFSDISENTHNNLIRFLDIPNNYKIFYLSSAIEAMEVIIRNFVIKDSFHLVNGVFSKKFYEVSKELGKNPEKEEIEWGKGNFSYEVSQNSEIICLTQNESSTGVYIPNEKIRNLRKNNPNKLIAVDVVSSIGGVFPNISDADIWFFSVQKCFGLPSGLGIMIVNEKAIEKSKKVYEINKDIGYVHSIKNMLKRYDKYQTNETPNVLDIYLLSKQLERFNKIGKENIEKETMEKFEILNNFFDKNLDYFSYVKDKDFISPTIYVFEIKKDKQEILKNNLLKNGIVLGNGYGKLKYKTMRIANFPSIKKENIEKLISYF